MNLFTLVCLCRKNFILLKFSVIYILLWLHMIHEIVLRVFIFFHEMPHFSFDDLILYLDDMPNINSFSDGLLCFKKCSSLPLC